MGNEITPRFTVVSQKFVKESTMFVNVWYKNLYFNCHKEDWMYNWSMKLVKIYKIKEQYKKMYKNTRFSTPKKLTTPLFPKNWMKNENKQNQHAGNIQGGESAVDTAIRSIILKPWNWIDAILGWAQ